MVTNGKFILDLLFKTCYNRQTNRGKDMNKPKKSWCLVRLGTLALANKKVVSKDTECITDQYGAWWRVGKSNIFRLEKECSAEFVVT